MYMFHRKQRCWLIGNGVDSKIFGLRRRTRHLQCTMRDITRPTFRSMEDIPQDILTLAERARQAAILLPSTTTQQRNEALDAICKSVMRHKPAILDANLLDLSAADARVAAGTMTSAMRKRLVLDDAKFDGMVNGVRDVMQLDDPTGKVTLAKEVTPGVELYRVTVPLGVLLVIFEARPEVLVNVAALALKSGNACILKGGSEAQHTNAALYLAISEALNSRDLSKLTTATPLDDEGAEEACVPAGSVQLVSSRASVQHLLHLDRHVDLVIPRGSNALVKHIQNNTRIPVLGHADGICSIYIHKDADVDVATRIVVDAKVNYPAACNAVETLLIHKDAVKRVLPPVAHGLWSKNVVIKADTDAMAILASMSPGRTLLQPAVDQDFDTEFLDLIIAVKVVPSLSEAMSHINTHGSRHTDAIVTASSTAADRFMRGVDAAGVYWNTSTRFADGFRYGFGAEVGVSTNKVHARGPVGVEGLVTYKYRMYGNGATVGSMEGKESVPGKTYTHRPLERRGPWMDPGSN